MVAAFCWKLGKAYCGFGEEEDAKPGVLSVSYWMGLMGLEMQPA